MATIALPDWMNSDLLWVGGAVIAASIALVGMAGLRRIPMRERAVAVLIRVVVLLCAVGMLAEYSFTSESRGPSGLVIIDASAPSGIQIQARDLATKFEARLWLVDDQGVSERGLAIASRPVDAIHRMAARIGTGVEDRPLFLEAWLKAEDLASAEPAMAVLGVPFAARALVPEAVSPAKERAIAPIESVVPSVKLLGPPVVLAHEPMKFNLSLRGMPDGVSVSVRLDGAAVGFRAAGLDEYETDLLTFEPGEHELSAVARLGDVTIGEAFRSVVAVAGEEVIVLSRRRGMVDAFHAMLPRFKVVGIDPVKPLEASYLAKARTVILPLDEPGEWDPGLAAILTEYAAGGGLVIATGRTEEHARERDIPPEILALLPVILHAPPELPPEPEPPKPEDPPKDPAPDSPIPGPPKVKKEEGEAEVAKVSVVFVIDHSGSMSIGGRWTHAVAAVKSALENIQSYDRIGILLFGDKPEWAIGGGIVDVEPGMSAAIRDHLDSPANGPKEATLTDIYGAVDTALVALGNETSSVRLIVLISDGDEGPNRKVDADHIALATRAMAAKTMIATIRVGTDGPAEFVRRADKVMTGLATRDDLRSAVSDVDGAIRIPSLSLVYVQLAYRRYSEIQAEKQKERDEAEAEAQRLAEEEAKRRAEAERARIAALEEEERRREEERLAREEEERRRRAEEAAKRMLPGGFRQGLVELVVEEGAREMLGWPETLPPIGENLQAAVTKAGVVTMARTLSERRRGVGLAHQSKGFGGFMWFRAPLDSVNAGSWLSNSDHTSALLDPMIRRLSASKLGALTPVSSFDIDAGRAVAVVTRPIEGLRMVGVTSEGRELSLETTTKGDRAIAIVHPAARMVELRAADGSVLARASAVKVRVRQDEASASAAVPVGGESDIVHAAPETIIHRHEDRSWRLGLLVLALMLMPIERWFRRI